MYSLFFYFFSVQNSIDDFKQETYLKGLFIRNFHDFLQRVFLLKNSKNYFMLRRFHCFLLYRFNTENDQNNTIGNLINLVHSYDHQIFLRITN